MGLALQYFQMRFQLFKILGLISLAVRQEKNIFGVMCDNVLETTKKRKGKLLQLSDYPRLFNYQNMKKYILRIRKLKRNSIKLVF